jgi:hypothetical protein
MRPWQWVYQSRFPCRQHILQLVVCSNGNRFPAVNAGCLCFATAPVMHNGVGYVWLLNPNPSSTGQPVK